MRRVVNFGYADKELNVWHEPALEDMVKKVERSFTKSLNQIFKELSVTLFVECGGPYSIKKGNVFVVRADSELAQMGIEVPLDETFFDTAFDEIFSEEKPAPDLKEAERVARLFEKTAAKIRKQIKEIAKC